MEQENQVQMEQENQTRGAQIASVLKDKKKRPLIIAAACIAAAIILAIVAVMAMGGQNDKGKDPYELFAYGTKKETVFEKLDKMGIDYYLNGSGDQLSFHYENVQDSDAPGDADLYFSPSDKLKSIDVKVFCLTDTEPAEIRSACVSALEGKYGPHTEDERGNSVWQNKSWTIELSKRADLENIGYNSWNLYYSLKFSKPE